MIMHEEPSDYILTTERLVARVPRYSDLPRLVTFATENRAHLAPWEPSRPDAYFTESFWHDEIEPARRDYLNGWGVRLILQLRDEPTGPIVGRVNYSNIVRGVFQACHLGYALGENFQGQGLMMEALRSTNVFVFQKLHLHRIMANYMPRNERSARLLNQLGFREEGLARDYLKIAGRWEDHVLTSLINSHYDNTEESHE